MDMPALTDARRVVRLAMMVDEVRRIACMYLTNQHAQIRSTISDAEFFICGGQRVHGKQYSLYRQLVYAKRDVDAYAKRSCFPNGRSVQKALSLYAFYPTDNEDIDDETPVSFKQVNRMLRVAFVLKRFRRFMRMYRDTLHTDEARHAFCAIELSKDEFVMCGGHRTVSAKKMYSFYRQIVQAKRDMDEIMQRGRFNNSKSKEVPECISSSGEEEDVDEFDACADAEEQEAWECLANENELDDAAGDDGS